MHPHCWWWGPGYFFVSPWSVAIGIVFWSIVLIVLFRVAILFTSLWNHEPPIETLKRRYAKGEIDAEEFARKKHDLESTPAPHHGR